MNCFKTKDVKLDQLFRKGVIGGRCEAFKKGYFEGEFVMIDFVSLYPSVML